MQPATRIAQALSRSPLVLKLVDIQIPSSKSELHNPNVTGVLSLASEVCWRSVTHNLGINSSQHLGQNHLKVYRTIKVIQVSLGRYSRD